MATTKEMQERDARVLSGKEVAPACYTCGKPSTHVTDGITPTGYRAYQCARHAALPPLPLWGSDPGWNNDYVPLPTASMEES